MQSYRIKSLAVTGSSALLVAVVAVAVVAASQRTVEWSGQPILINASYNKITEMHFPEEIATVLSNTDQFSVVVKGRYLYIKPLVAAADENVYVLTRQGASYPLLVKVGDERDGSVEILSAVKKAKQAIKETTAITPLVLIKAMMRRDALPGFDIAEADKLVYERDGFLEIRLTRVYTSPFMWGYVLRVENKAAFPVRISPQEIDMPGLLAISIDEEYLTPQATTSSELVAGGWRTAMYLVIAPDKGMEGMVGLPGLAE